MDAEFTKKQTCAPAAHKLPLSATKHGKIYQIQFGNPKSECRNFGICRVDNLEGKLKKAVNACPAKIAFRDSGKIEISFFREYLSVEAEEIHFSKGWFLVESEYVFSNDLLRHPGIAARINKGLYKITATEKFYKVIF